MHSCPERVSFLLQSVSGVVQAQTDFVSAESHVRAKGALCTDQRSLLLSVQPEYSATVLSVDIGK
jgi:hypothetical protein